MVAMPHILADNGVFWLGQRASTIAPQVDWLYNFILGICVFFFLLIAILMVVFCIKYRYREGVPPPSSPKHNTALELTWTFVPTVILVIIFYYGFTGFIRMNVAPPDPYEIVVAAQMWSYNFRYPNGHIDPVLHIPVDTPVQFVLTSSDVIHGFYMPAFRIKKDIVPDRFNKIWINANETGEFPIYCTQYCGQGHSTMRSTVVVQTIDDFRNWVDHADEVGGTPADRGKHLWETRGCNQCHTIDGTAGRAPTWKDVYGSDIHFKDGTHQIADENYLHLMITQPNSKQIPGFDPIMPPTAGILSAKDVGNLIAFIKTLSVHYHPEGRLTTRPGKNPTAVEAPLGSLGHPSRINPGTPPPPTYVSPK